MGVEFRQCLPFFNNGDDISSHRWLPRDAVFEVNGRTVFDAPCFGMNQGHQLVEFLQKVRAPTDGQLNRSYDVNHLVFPYDLPR